MQAVLLLTAATCSFCRPQGHVAPMKVRQVLNSTVWEECVALAQLRKNVPIGYNGTLHIHHLLSDKLKNVRPDTHTKQCLTGHTKVLSDVHKSHSELHRPYRSLRQNSRGEKKQCPKAARQTRRLDGTTVDVNSLPFVRHRGL